MLSNEENNQRENEEVIIVPLPEGQTDEKQSRINRAVNKITGALSRIRMRGNPREGQRVRNEHQEIHRVRGELKAQDVKGQVEGSRETQEAWSKQINQAEEQERAKLAQLDSPAFLKRADQTASTLYETLIDTAGSRDKAIHATGVMQAYFAELSKREAYRDTDAQVPITKIVVSKYLLEAMVNAEGLTGRPIQTCAMETEQKLKIVSQELQRTNNLFGPKTNEQFNAAASVAEATLNRQTGHARPLPRLP